MQRTYGRRALRRRSGVQSRTGDCHEPDDPSLSNPSPPRKRQKVFVEIVSPKHGKNTYHGHSGPGGISGSPKTPENSLRDLASDLFATPPHQSRSGSQPTRGSIVKRMLGRSRTDASIEATPSMEVTPSTQMTRAREASSHSLPTMFPEQEITPEASTQPKPLLTQNIRTYASSRSFLVALPVPDAGPLNAVEDDTEPQESYADLRSRWGIDLSEDDPQQYQDQQAAVPTPLRRNRSELSQPSLPTGMMNDLKSITELRSKGESRRFLDEVGYLFEGLDSSSAISLRRASALEIVNKLCDLDFNRRAKTSDFYVRTWDKLRAARAGSSDKIFDITISFFATLASRDLRTLIEVAQQEGFVSTLVEILSSFDHRKDVLASALETNLDDDDLKSHGILRTEITALKSLARLVEKESHSPFVEQPSARFFVSYSLATLPPSLLADQHLPALLVNLRTELSLLEPRIIAYESGLPLMPPTSISRSDMPSLWHIETCLRLLDSYLLGLWSSADPPGDRCSSRLSHMGGFTSELVSLCIASSSLLQESEETGIARRCLCGAMRVLTLLSHEDPWWCSAALEISHALPFVCMTVMRSQAKWSESRNTDTQKGSVEAFDLLCLALGLFMNWATLSPKVAVFSRAKLIDPMCPGSRSCVRACRCPGQKSVLECFTTLHAQYSNYRQDGLPECAFLRGYTAILLGLLIKDDPLSQTIVISILPGTSTSDSIKSLIAHCHSFLDLYDDTMLLPSSDSPRATPEVHAHEATDRHRAKWDKRGEEIARSVITSLETLCDT